MDRRLVPRRKPLSDPASELDEPCHSSSNGLSRGTAFLGAAVLAQSSRSLCRPFLASQPGSTPLDETKRNLELGWRWVESNRVNRGPVRCEPCRGTGRVECKFCNGTGLFTVGEKLLCSTSGNCYCVVCKSLGECECKRCCGTGRVASWISG